MTLQMCTRWVPRSNLVCLYGLHWYDFHGFPDFLQANTGNGLLNRLRRNISKFQHTDLFVMIFSSQWTSRKLCSQSVFMSLSYTLYKSQERQSRSRKIPTVATPLSRDFTNRNTILCDIRDSSIIFQILYLFCLQFREVKLNVAA
jgi:hypothetical protein